MRKKSVLKFHQDADTHYEAANAALDRGEYILALSHINAARRIDPLNADHRMLAGDAYFEMGLYQRALDQEMALLAMTMFLERPSFDLVYGCVRSLLAMGERNAAMQYLELALAICDDFSPDILASYGEDMPTLMAIAENESNLVMTDTDEDDKNSIKLALLYLRNEDYSDALDLLTSVRVDSRHYWTAQSWLTDCLWAIGDTKALKLRAEAMREQEGSWAATVAAARAYAFLGDRDELNSLCERLKSYRGEDVAVLGFGADALSKSGDFETAYDFIRRALRHFPYDTQLLTMQAMILSQTDRLDESGNVLLTVLEIDPYDTVAMYHNGRLQDGIKIPLDPFRLPQEEITKRVLTIFDIYESDRKDMLDAMEKSYNLAILRWVLLNGYMVDDNRFEILFTLGESPRCEFLFREIVASSQTPRKIKELLAAVMIYSWSTDLCVSVGYFVTQIDCRLPAHAKENDVYLQAWAYLLATLSQCAVKYEKVARSLFSKLLQARFKPKCTPQQLAAVILGVMLMEYKDSVEFFSAEGIFVGLVEDAQELQSVMKTLMPALIASGILKKPEEN